MRNSGARTGAACTAMLVIFTLGLGSLAAQYREALPGYQFEFPRDYFNHPDFQTEWWYYTGNVTASDGRSYGFELTFFRIGVSRDSAPKSDWAINDVYMAHLALSDIDRGQFYHRERLNRAGPGVAGASADTSRIWNGNWRVQFDGNAQSLEAISDEFTLQLQLNSQKPPVVHGVDGVSQKSAGAGRASHYFSLTRLATSGTIELRGEKIPVTGTAWMDHEFFTEQLNSEQTGWDWLSMQFDDNTELMLFRLRRKDGSLDPFSSGTYVDAAGKPTHIDRKDFTLGPTGESWVSPQSKAQYPIGWRLEVSPLQLKLNISTPLKQQEISGTASVAPSYWEGAIRITGDRNGPPIHGVGYLEMTGYDKPFNLASQTRP